MHSNRWVGGGGFRGLWLVWVGCIGSKVGGVAVGRGQRAAAQAVLGRKGGGVAANLKATEEGCVCLCVQLLG